MSQDTKFQLLVAIGATLLGIGATVIKSTINPHMSMWVEVVVMALVLWAWVAFGQAHDDDERRRRKAEEDSR